MRETYCSPKLINENTIIATFLEIKILEGFFPVYAFSNISDLNEKKYKDKWIRETQLLKYACLEIGKVYTISFSGPIMWAENGPKFPNPLYISDGENKFYVRNSNAIIREDKYGSSVNLSRRAAEEEM